MERLSFKLTISQKLNLIFGLFFVSTTAVTIINAGLVEAFSHGDGPGMIAITTAGIGMLVLSRWDFAVIRYGQFFLLLLVSIAVILTNANFTNVTGWLTLTITLAAGYKMELFGRRLGSVLVVSVVLSILATIGAAFISHKTFLTTLNYLLFMVAFIAILYVLFEEEILGLRQYGEQLEQNVRELKPFADLGENAVGVVHDFKGDIQVLSAIIELEEQDRSDETLERLRSVSQRLESRVNSIMYIANGQAVQEPEDVNLHELVDSAMYYFAGLNRYLKHSVTYNIEGDRSAIVHARRGSILVIVENVIKNAIEANEGMARREINAAIRTEDTQAVLTFDNTGRPLPWKATEPIDVLTSPVFDRGRTTKDTGSGVGMVNVKTALKSLGGTMTMENTDAGVRSIVRLPRVTLEAEAAPETAG